MLTEANPNLVLIGMPSAGKSTLGVLVAKALGMDFLDTDILLQARSGTRLQTLMDRHGRASFLKLESDAVLSVDVEGTVVATGGSVVYAESAMVHLKRNAFTVYLEVPLEEVVRRLGDASTRGIALRPGQALADLFAERVPLYERYADAVLPFSVGTSMQEMALRLRLLVEDAWTRRQA